MDALFKSTAVYHYYQQSIIVDIIKNMSSTLKINLMNIINTLDSSYNKFPTKLI